MRLHKVSIILPKEKGVFRMLLLVSEYSNAYPHRSLQALDKFKDLPNYLHEMSIAEINEFVSHWKPLSSRTAYNQKQQILHYFQWLQTQGVKVDANIAYKIEIPISKKQFLIYSTSDLQNYYEILFDYLEEKNKKANTTWSKSTYYMCYAAGILSFYGLTEEQIIDLNLTDITTKGVIGYDLPLTKHDIDILMTYKNTVKLGNNMPLCGDKYIRSTHINTIIEPSFLSRPLWRITFDKEHIYLKNLLRTNNLYLLGTYNRIYQIENKDIQIEPNKVAPDWFISMFNDSLGLNNASAISMRKKEYIEYREERSEAEKNTKVSKDTDIQEENKTYTFETTNDELVNKMDELFTPSGNPPSQDELLKIIENLTSKMSSMADEITELKSLIK